MTAKEDEHAAELATLQENCNKSLLELVNQQRIQAESLKAKIAALKSEKSTSASRSSHDRTSPTRSDAAVSEEASSGSTSRRVDLEPVRKSKKRRFQNRDEYRDFELTFAEDAPTTAKSKRRVKSEKDKGKKLK
eukprot:gb/GEZN01015822.1/.p1 GENE.gb/GEZN01015822.1/~~gb/GEZN01015822.1/.p1  ORF type:complete len:134 (-),score=26.53 gb/GEZN01015822.1/:302-703(-)